MPIIVEWLADKRACFVTLPDIFDDDELRNHETVMVNWLDEGEENKYIIADVSAMKKVPSLKQAMMLKHMRHTRLTQGVTVGLSLNPVARFVVSSHQTPNKSSEQTHAEWDHQGIIVAPRSLIPSETHLNLGGWPGQSRGSVCG